MGKSKWKSARRRITHPDTWGKLLPDGEDLPRDGEVPPELSAEELKQVEADPDQVELQRLIKMGVICPVTSEDLSDHRFLTTRNVYDWRWRMDEKLGKFVWKRRSRLVGRDCKALNPCLEGLFSPTSNVIGNKLWAAVSQARRGELQLQLLSVDVKDAYLMVDQEEKVYVEEDGEYYILGKCLPGQRVGSKSWYNLLAKVLTEKMGQKPYAASPAVFFSIEGSVFVVSTHVDDLQLLGSEESAAFLFKIFEAEGWTLQIEGPCSPHCRESVVFSR